MCLQKSLSRGTTGDCGLKPSLAIRISCSGNVGFAQLKPTRIFGNHRCEYNTPSHRPVRMSTNLSSSCQNTPKCIQFRILHFTNFQGAMPSYTHTADRCRRPRGPSQSFAPIIPYYKTPGLASAVLQKTMQTGRVMPKRLPDGLLHLLFWH